MKELSIVEAVSGYLYDMSFRTVTELPFLQRRIDIVGYKSTQDTLVAVEAKVKNWQTAVRQAITCLLFADEVYIAMPAEYVHRVNILEIAKFGIGLMEVNSVVKIISPAVSSRYTSDHHRKNVFDRIKWLETFQQKGQSNVSQ